MGGNMTPPTKVQKAGCNGSVAQRRTLRRLSLSVAIFF